MLLNVYVRPVMLLAVVLCAGTVAAAGPTELPGAQDPAVLSRYKGAVLHNAAQERFASVRIPLGPGRIKGSDLVFDTSITVEGKISAYYYVQPPEAQPLEVFRNYQNALSQAGFKPLYTCELDACNKALIAEPYRSELLSRRPWADRINPGAGSSPRELRYWSGKASRDGQDLFVIVWVTEATSVWNAATATVVLVAPQAMEGGKVTASLEQMQRGLQTEGKIALHGVFFDTGKVELKPESKAQLDEMAKLLKTNVGLRVFIIGHTDNQGALDMNLQLSQRRAEAVANALVTQYGIDAKRVLAKGVANYSPVASNADEAGQSRNRRVELVAQ